MYACNESSGIVNCAWKENTISFLDFNNLLNKRSELLARCCHESKYLLCNLMPDWAISLSMSTSKSRVTQKGHNRNEYIFVQLMRCVEY